MHYNTNSSRDVKRGKKFTLKMPLQRTKKFIRLKIPKLTEWQRVERKQPEMWTKEKTKQKGKEKGKKTKKSSGGGVFL